jgi:hypothetical protein
LRRRIGLLAELDPDDSAFFGQGVGEIGQFILDIGQALAHESLHRIDGPFRIPGQVFFCRIADDEPVIGQRNDGGNHRPLMAACDDTGRALVHIGDKGVRCSKVYADDACHGDYAMVATRSLTMFFT